MTLMILPTPRRTIRLIGFLIVISLGGFCAALLMSGCRVGPKYVQPVVPPPPAAFKETTPDAYKGTADGTWKPANPQDAMLKGKWWEVFQEPELNALEEQVNVSNQNIAQYFQNFMAARSQVREAKAGLSPTVSVAPSYSRARSPGTLHGYGVTSTGSSGGSGTSSGTTTAGGGTYTDLALPFDVSWEPDLWGRVRNQISEYRYAAQVSAADLENERLTEQADLAEYYFELRGQDALQNVYDEMVRVDRQTLDLTKVLEKTGIDSAISTAEAENTLKNAEEVAAGVAQNRAVYEHAIATLIGKSASTFSISKRELTTKVPSIPTGMPSQLLQRRPDVAAAERTMAEANALIGIEKAAYYPSLDLTGSGGLESSTITTLFSLPALFWSVGASASETIFDAGLRKATVAQYTAQYNADVAAYKQTVLTAFQQVEDYMAGLRVTSDQVSKERQAIDAANRYVKLETARYNTGIDPYLDVLTAKTTLLNDEETQITVRINEMTAAVELIQALGGGWDVSQLPSANGITSQAAADQMKNQP